MSQDRRIPTLQIAAVCAATFAVSCGGDVQHTGPVGETDGGAMRVTDTSQSWDVDVKVTSSTSVEFAKSPCRPRSITLNISADEKFVTVGRDGTGNQGALKQVGDNYEGASSLAIAPGADCPNYSIFRLQQFTLHTEKGADGALPSHITGSATGTAEGGGEVLSYAPITLELSGVPATAPRLLVDGASPRSPFAQVNVLASQPLTGETMLWLGTDHAFSLEARDFSVGGPKAKVLFASDVVLPFSGSWVIAGSGADLANVPLDPQLYPTVQTVDDPGVLTDGTFETPPPPGILSTTAKVVGSAAGLSAIEGASSLWLNGGQTTFHLKRHANEQTLVFSMIAVPDSDWQQWSVSWKLGVPGHRAVNGRTPAELAAAMPTGDPDRPLASTVSEQRIPIGDEGDDVYWLLDLKPFPTVPSGGYFPPAVLIDNVHLE